MCRRVTIVYWTVYWTLAAIGAATAFAAPAGSDAATPTAYQTVTLRGRVEWLAETLSRRHGIGEVPEAAERVLVLVAPDGALHPLVEDIRGRAFRRDVRLRHRDVELIVRRYHGSPFVQVIQAFELRADGKYELDYWCDICSITMFELKECDCCQGPIELRHRKVSGPAPPRTMP